MRVYTMVSNSMERGCLLVTLLDPLGAWSLLVSLGLFFVSLPNCYFLLFLMCAIGTYVIFIFGKYCMTDCLVHVQTFEQFIVIIGSVE